MFSLGAICVTMEERLWESVAAPKENTKGRSTATPNSFPYIIVNSALATETGLNSFLCGSPATPPPGFSTRRVCGGKGGGPSHVGPEGGPHPPSPRGLDRPRGRLPPPEVKFSLHLFVPEHFDNFTIFCQHSPNFAKFCRKKLRENAVFQAQKIPKFFLLWGRALL